MGHSVPDYTVYCLYVEVAIESVASPQPLQRGH